MDIPPKDYIRILNQIIGRVCDITDGYHWTYRDIYDIDNILDFLGEHTHVNAVSRRYAI